LISATQNSASFSYTGSVNPTAGQEIFIGFDQMPYLINSVDTGLKTFVASRSWSGRSSSNMTAMVYNGTGLGVPTVKRETKVENLTLIGANNANVVGQTLGSALCTFNNVNILANFTGNFYPIVELPKSSHIKFIDCQFAPISTGNPTALRMSQAYSLTIKDCVSLGCQQAFHNFEGGIFGVHGSSIHFKAISACFSGFDTTRVSNTEIKIDNIYNAESNAFTTSDANGFDSCVIKILNVPFAASNGSVISGQKTVVDVGFFAGHLTVNGSGTAGNYIILSSGIVTGQLSVSTSTFVGNVAYSQVIGTPLKNNGYDY
jgi:hypothetical protein